ncbi:hypothetical protein HJG60_008785 [Phyllostomus discolor]|uniref:Uncharacterized protein n=1 Tax=Phyllostomus discolor TaxID=89673 RepID=A0A833YZC6_9CHIR|nr:hypothetical protein HJG60_008785 [Phyllostomus discolor]
MDKWSRADLVQETPAHDLLGGQTRHRPLSLAAAAPRAERDTTTPGQSLSRPSVAGATYHPHPGNRGRSSFVSMARLRSPGPSGRHSSVWGGAGGPIPPVTPFTMGLCTGGGDAHGQTRRGCAQHWHPGRPTQPLFSGGMALLEGGLLGKCPPSRLGPPHSFEPQRCMLGPQSPSSRPLGLGADRLVSLPVTLGRSGGKLSLLKSQSPRL